MVQQLAAMTGTKLVVLNLSQQTDSSDLLGGFRPIQVFSPAATHLSPLRLMELYMNAMAGPTFHDTLAGKVPWTFRSNLATGRQPRVSS